MSAPFWLSRVGPLMVEDDHPRAAMKTLRIRLPVLAMDDEARFLDLVTRVPGVVAALVDEKDATLEVVLSRHATALLVQQQVRDTLWAGAAVTA